jgi:prephenate dehydratase
MVKVAFQGVAGAYSHMAVQKIFPQGRVVPCLTFEDVLESVEQGAVDYAVIPIENSTAGRVADIHQLMPHTSLYVVGEYYLPVHHCLLGVPGAVLEDIETVFSHEQALAQCKAELRRREVQATSFSDTAGAAEFIAREQKKECGALASSLAAEIYGLDILVPDMQDADHNTTRFLTLARKPVDVPLGQPCKTAMVFQVRSIPAALYKALGGFATNGVNLTKLESYVEGKHFEVARFFAEIEGHQEEEATQRALEELAFFSQNVRLLGTYPRKEIQE